MALLALGVEHTTCPLAVREAVALDPDAVARMTRHLQDAGPITELAVLSTCNRTEIFLVADDAGTAAALATAELIRRDERVAPYLRTWEEMATAEHLFRIACGLESQSLGEAQILGQVRDALETAQQLGSIGPTLHALFRAAIACARQGRAGTALGRVNLSLGTEAVHAAERMMGSLSGRTALVIGGGEISRLVAQELRDRQIGTLIIANRTESVAADLALRLGGRPARLADVPSLLPRIDVLFSATSAPRFVLHAEDIPAMSGRREPLQVFDLALPRDLDPTIGNLPGIELHDLDTLMPETLDEHWAEDVRAMEAVIAAELHEFSAWYLTRRVVPVIANLRAHVEAVSAQELRRVAPQLKGLTERERAAVESLTNRLVDKMFHHLVTRLRLAAQTDPALIDAAEFFFLHGEGGLFPHAAEEEAAEAVPVEEEG